MINLAQGPLGANPVENVHLTGPQAMQTPVSLGQIKRTGPDGGSDGKESTCNTGDPGSILCWEDPLEEGTATHSSILAWRIPWTEEIGGLQFMGSQRVRHD